MDDAYRRRAGALADKYNLARLPVAPKQVGDDLYPDPQSDSYQETIICTFIRIDTLTTEMTQQDIAHRLADDEVTAIEALPDTRVEDRYEYLLRVTDTADTDPLIGYYEAADLDIGFVLGQQLQDPWGVFYCDTGFLDGRFTDVISQLQLFTANGSNRLDEVRAFRQRLTE